MRSLLRYASNAKVARALGVSRASVSEWSRGNDVSPYRVEQVRALMAESVGDIKKEAAPDLPGRLDKIERYLRVMARGLPVPAAVLAEIEAAHHDVSGGAHEPPPPGATRRKGGRRPRGK